MASDFDPDNRVVPNPQGAVVQQGGNVSSRLPGRTTFTATPAQATQGGVNPGSVSVDTLKGRVEAASDVYTRADAFKEAEKRLGTDSSDIPGLDMFAIVGKPKPRKE